MVHPLCFFFAAAMNKERPSAARHAWSHLFFSCQGRCLRMAFLHFADLVCIAQRRSQHEQTFLKSFCLGHPWQPVGAGFARKGPPKRLDPFGFTYKTKRGTNPVLRIPYRMVHGVSDRPGVQCQDSWCMTCRWAHLMGFGVPGW